MNTMNNIRIMETKPDADILHILIQLSCDWEDEDSCYGYRKNCEEDIKGNRIFIAQDGPIVIGYLFGHRSLSDETNSIMPEKTAVFEVEELYIKPEYRSQGIGKRLFRHMEEAVLEDADYIMLSTATKNWKAILHFYLEELDMQFWNARLFKEIKK